MYLAAAFAHDFALRSLHGHQETLGSRAGVTIAMKHYIKHLIGLFWGQSKEHDIPSSPPDKLCFLALPLDIIHLISTRLELHDRFFLSQTCRALRVLFRENWKEVDGLSYADRMRFWTGLAYVLPRHWVCSACCELHPMDPKDTPRRPAYECLNRLNEPLCFRYLHHHVQLALKIHRLGGHNHQRYLSALMATVSHQQVRGCLKATHTFRPKIVHERFILFEEWTFKVPPGHAAIAPSDMRLIVVRHCSHLRLPGPSTSPLRRTPAQVTLEHMIAQAFAQEGFEISHYCYRCPTDLSFFVARGARQVVFRAWRDYGPASSPIDAIWMSHERRIRIGGQPKPDLTHEPGSVRAMYPGDSQETKTWLPSWMGLGV